MSTKHLKNVVSTKAQKETPQTVSVPGKNMVANNAGGFTFAVDVWTQLDRFLVLGSEGGTFYVGEKELTKENATNVIKAIDADGVRVVNRVVEISEAKRAPKNDPALFVLALVMTYGNDEAKRAAEKAVPQVARIGTHILHLADFVNDMRGWGRGIRRAFGNWYNGQSALDLAKQVTKYANRDGWTHLDVLRKAHVKPVSSTHDAIFADIKGPAKQVEIDADVAEYMAAVEELKSLSKNNVKRAVELITAFQLPREVVPTELHNEPKVWEALIPHMGMEALVRNLATMTRIGLIAPLSSGQKTVLAKMQNESAIIKSGIHPIKLLSAYLTYKSGMGFKGGNSWTPLPAITQALNDMFYVSFKGVTPTGKRTLMGLDISSSMSWNFCSGMPQLSCAMGSGALAMVNYRSENPADVHVLGFSTGLIDLGISANMTLDQVMTKIANRNFGGTDCSLPMTWALQNKVAVDTFLVYTDNETYAGNIHPFQAIKQYRDKTGIPAKLVVVAMTSNQFSIADPSDAGMMDVVGFDANTPALISDFSKSGF
jgi:60 kDa SS-A/Ro ribonucleoprotein